MANQVPWSWDSQYNQGQPNAYSGHMPSQQYFNPQERNHHNYQDAGSGKSNTSYPYPQYYQQIPQDQWGWNSQAPHTSHAYNAGTYEQYQQYPQQQQDTWSWGGEEGSGSVDDPWNWGTDENGSDSTQTGGDPPSESDQDGSRKQFPLQESLGMEQNLDSHQEVPIEAAHSPKDIQGDLRIAPQDFQSDGTQVFAGSETDPFTCTSIPDGQHLQYPPISSDNHISQNDILTLHSHGILNVSETSLVNGDSAGECGALPLEEEPRTDSVDLVQCTEGSEHNKFSCKPNPSECDLGVDNMCLVHASNDGSKTYEYVDMSMVSGAGIVPGSDGVESICEGVNGVQVSEDAADDSMKQEEGVTESGNAQQTMNLPDSGMPSGFAGQVPSYHFIPQSSSSLSYESSPTETAERSPHLPPESLGVSQVNLEEDTDILREEAEFSHSGHTGLHISPGPPQAVLELGLDSREGDGFQPADHPDLEPSLTPVASLFQPQSLPLSGQNALQVPRGDGRSYSEDSPVFFSVPDMEVSADDRQRAHLLQTLEARGETIGEASPTGSVSPTDQMPSRYMGDLSASGEQILYQEDNSHSHTHGTGTVPLVKDSWEEISADRAEPSLNLGPGPERCTPPPRKETIGSESDGLDSRSAAKRSNVPEKGSTLGGPHVKAIQRPEGEGIENDHHDHIPQHARRGRESSDEGLDSIYSSSEHAGRSSRQGLRRKGHSRRGTEDSEESGEMDLSRRQKDRKHGDGSDEDRPSRPDQARSDADGGYRPYDRLHGYGNKKSGERKSHEGSRKYDRRLEEQKVHEDEDRRKGTGRRRYDEEQRYLDDTRRRRYRDEYDEDRSRRKYDDWAREERRRRYERDDYDARDRQKHEKRFSEEKRRLEDDYYSKKYSRRRTRGYEEIPSGRERHTSGDTDATYRSRHDRSKAQYESHHDGIGHHHPEKPEEVDSSGVPQLSLDNISIKKERDVAYDKEEDFYQPYYDYQQYYESDRSRPPSQLGSMSQGKPFRDPMEYYWQQASRLPAPMWTSWEAYNRQMESHILMTMKKMKTYASHVVADIKKAAQEVQKDGASETGDGKRSVSSAEGDVGKSKPKSPYIPHKYTGVHCIARFGNNNRLIRLAPSVDNNIDILDTKGVFKDYDRRAAAVRAFPGPLTRTSPKVLVMKYCKQQMDRLDPVTQADELLMWDYLMLLIKHNGVVYGVDVAMMIREHIRGEGEMLCSRSLHSLTEGEGACEGNGEKVAIAPNPAHLTDDSDGMVDVEDILLCGESKKIFEHCLNEKMWLHAVILGRALGEDHFRLAVRSGLESTPVSDPLRTLCEMLFGFMPMAVQRCGDKSIGDWRKHLAVTIAHLDNEGSSVLQLLEKMGDSLGARGCLYGSQLCYLLARVPFNSSAGDIGGKLVLLGSPMLEAIPGHAPESHIAMSELYEYGMQLGDPSFSLPHLVPFKMQKVIALLDIGNTEAAFDYIQSMAEVVLQHRFSFHFEKSLLLDMVRLGEQLKSIRMEFAHPELFPEWLLNLRTFVEQGGLPSQHALEDVSHPQHESAVVEEELSETQEQTQAAVDTSLPGPLQGQDHLEYSSTQESSYIGYSDGQGASLEESQQENGVGFLHTPFLNQVPSMPPSLDETSRHVLSDGHSLMEGHAQQETPWSTGNSYEGMLPSVPSFPNGTSMEHLSQEQQLNVYPESTSVPTTHQQSFNYWDAMTRPPASRTTAAANLHANDPLAQYHSAPRVPCPTIDSLHPKNGSLCLLGSALQHWSSVPLPAACQIPFCSSVPSGDLSNPVLPISSSIPFHLPGCNTPVTHHAAEYRHPLMSAKEKEHEVSERIHITAKKVAIKVRQMRPVRLVLSPTPSTSSEDTASGDHIAPNQPMCAQHLLQVLGSPLVCTGANPALSSNFAADPEVISQDALAGVIPSSPKVPIQRQISRMEKGDNEEAKSVCIPRKKSMQSMTSSKQTLSESSGETYGWSALSEAASDEEESSAVPLVSQKMSKASVSSVHSTGSGERRPSGGTLLSDRRPSFGNKHSGDFGRKSSTGSGGGTTNNMGGVSDEKISKENNLVSSDTSSSGKKGVGAGWFGGFFRIPKLPSRPKNQMILPADTNPAIVWDEKLRRWVNKDEPESESNKPPPPPPKDTELASQSLQTQAEPQPQSLPPASAQLSASAPSGPVASGTPVELSLLPEELVQHKSDMLQGQHNQAIQGPSQPAASPPVSNRFKRQRGMRPYVDVFNKGGGSSNAAPAPIPPVLPLASTNLPSNLFIPPPLETGTEPVDFVSSPREDSATSEGASGEVDQGGEVQRGPIFVDPASYANREPMMLSSKARVLKQPYPTRQGY